VAEDTVTGMYIYSQICYLFHWTTSFVVYFVGWLLTLYTTVVRFSFNQMTDDSKNGIPARLARPPRLKPRDAGRARDGGQVEQQNKEPQNREAITSIFEIPCSIFCGSKRR